MIKNIFVKKEKKRLFKFMQGFGREKYLVYVIRNCDFRKHFRR